MQETEIDITSNDEQGFFEKIKNWSYENWQTILVVLIVLIVGMSAYNYNQNNSGTSGEENSLALTEENSDTGEEINNEEESMDENVDANQNSESSTEASDQQSAEAEDSNTQDKQENINETNTNKQEEGTVLSDTDESGKIYTISASKGEGITHLARHALEKYLQETGQNSDLTPEHKIYIEDYMQNRKGNTKIEIGHEEIFSENLIKEAISSARSLSSKSLDNLKKYTTK